VGRGKKYTGTFRPPYTKIPGSAVDRNQFAAMKHLSSKLMQNTFLVYKSANPSFWCQFGFVPKIALTISINQSINQNLFSEQ